MEEMFKKLDLERGINISIKTDLRFADDIALLSNSVKNTETQLNGLNMTNFNTTESINMDN